MTKENEKAKAAKEYATIMRCMLTAAEACRRLQSPIIHDNIMDVWRYAEAQWRMNQPA